MIARNFQSDINGRLAEVIKNDKSRFMTKVDYNDLKGTGPFKDRKGLIYKVNLPEGLVVVTLSARDNDPEEVIVRLDKDLHKSIYERNFSSGSYEDNYQLGYIIYREICDRLESSKSMDGILERYELSEIG